MVRSFVIECGYCRTQHMLLRLAQISYHGSYKKDRKEGHQETSEESRCKEVHREARFS